MDLLQQQIRSRGALPLSWIPKRFVTAAARTQVVSQHSASSSIAYPATRRIRRQHVPPVRAGDVQRSSDSSDEDGYEQDEEQLLQDYLQKVYAKRAANGNHSPIIRCLNCTQPAPFNGVCQCCGHAHANDTQLTYVPLEYSRSAYVHMRQQQLLAHQQRRNTEEPQIATSSSASTNTSTSTSFTSTAVSAGADDAWSSAVNDTAAVRQSEVSVSTEAEELKFDGRYIAEAAAVLDPTMSDTPASPSSNGLTDVSPSQTSAQNRTSSSLNGASSATSSSLNAASHVTSSSLNGTNNGTSSSLNGTTNGTSSSLNGAANGTASSGGSSSGPQVGMHARLASLVDGVHGEEPLTAGGVLLAWDDRTSQHQNCNNKPSRDEVTGLEIHTHMHPERPQRTQAIVSRLYRSGLLDRCHAIPARSVTEEELLLVHTPELISGVRDLSRAAAEYNSNSPDHTLDVGGDTYANRHTWDVCTMAAGMAVEVALRVARGEGSHGAAIVRPPGHHAEHNGVMGFCFLNHAAIAARAVQQATGVERVAIVDWDVHHGNGAQHILWDDPSVLTVSLHRYDNGNYFPGSGHVGEVGSGDGEGHVVNIPWSMPGMGDLEYLAAFDQVVVPVLKEFSPELIIVAAGFDSAALDPLGGCSLTPVGFAQMTQRLKSVGPVVMLLEGGYNLTATATCFEACLKVLSGESPPPLPNTDAPAFVALRLLSEVLEVQSQYWESLRPRRTTELMECYQWLGASTILHQILQSRRQSTTPSQPSAAAMV